MIPADSAWVADLAPNAATSDIECPFFFGHRVIFGTRGHSRIHVDDDTLDICTTSEPIATLTERIRMPFKLLGTVVDYTIESDGTRVVLRFGTVADFLVTRSRITCRIAPGTASDVVKWVLYGAVAGVWLELRGYCVLHGGVVASNDIGVAFLGSSGAGKSTLIAALSRLGRRVVADDHVVIDVRDGRAWVRPGLPWIKVSPATARYLGLVPEDLPPLHPAVRKRAWFHGAVDWNRVPLKHIVLLNRDHGHGDVPTDLRPLTPRQAFAALATNGYSPQAVRVLGYQARRLPVLARLSEVPGVGQVSYASGFSDLGRVAADVARLTE